MKGFACVKGLEAATMERIIMVLIHRLIPMGYTPIFLNTVIPGNLYDKLSLESNLRLFEVWGGVEESKRYGILRPEGTLLALAHVDERSSRVKNYYYGPMFRLERPGRFHQREFWQFCLEHAEKKDLDWIDDLEPLFFAIKELGLDPKINFNFLGSKTEIEERLAFIAGETGASIEEVRYRIDKDIMAKAMYGDPREIIRTLRVARRRGLPLRFAPTLIRGIHYYNHFVFELSVDGVVVAGGGHYDGLWGQIAPRKRFYRHFGWGLGLNRLVKLCLGRRERHV